MNTRKSAVMVWAAALVFVALIGLAGASYSQSRPVDKPAFAQVKMDCAGDCVENCQEANPNNEAGYSTCLANCLKGCDLPDVPDVPEPTPVPDPESASRWMADPPPPIFIPPPSDPSPGDTAGPGSPDDEPPPDSGDDDGAED